MLGNASEASARHFELRLEGLIHRPSDSAPDIPRIRCEGERLQAASTCLLN